MRGRQARSGYRPGPWKGEEGAYLTYEHSGL